MIYTLTVNHAETGVRTELHLTEDRARILYRANTTDYGQPIADVDQQWTWYTERGNEVTLVRSEPAWWTFQGPFGV